MTIRQLIAYLLQDNDIDDEILVAYWDKTYFVETNDLDRADVDKVWAEFIKQGQETLDGHLDFTQTGYDLAADLKELVEERDNE